MMVASDAESHSSEKLASPIQAVTFNSEISVSLPQMARGTTRLCLCASTTTSSTMKPSPPPMARVVSGGNSASSTFIAGQFMPQPTVVITSRSKPRWVAAEFNA